MPGCAEGGARRDVLRDAWGNEDEHALVFFTRYGHTQFRYGHTQFGPSA